MILAYLLWFLVVVVTGFIVYGFTVALIDHWQRVRRQVQNMPLPDPSNVRVLHREQP